MTTFSAHRKGFTPAPNRGGDTDTTFQECSTTHLVRGFTLVEILLATAIFSLTMLVATAVFITAQRTQRRTTSAQKLQDDTRFIMESIARTIKFTTVDYTCYNQIQETCYPLTLTGTTDPNVNLQTSFGRSNVLALRDATGIKTMYAVFIPGGGSTGEKKLQSCTYDPATDTDPQKCLQFTNWQTVTPEGVQAVRSSFLIAPFLDPFVQCPAGDTCANGSPYQADEQPHVTVILQTRPSGSGTIQSVTAQTTVTSRLYYR